MHSWPTLAAHGKTELSNSDVRVQNLAESVLRVPQHTGGKSAVQFLELVVTSFEQFSGVMMFLFLL